MLAGQARGGRQPAVLAREFPAPYATSLVFAGVFEYEGGDFWSAVNADLDRPNLEPGPAFLDAVQMLNLETFDSLVQKESVQAWIARSLAHGGVPISCLKPFAELLVCEASSGVTHGTELMSVWAVRPERLERLH